MKQLNLVEIPNPLQPAEAIRSTREFRAGATIQDLFPRVGTVELVISLNGKIVQTEERDKHYLNDGDYLVVAPVLRGGGDDGGKQVMRIAALIAIAVFAPELGALMGPGMFGAGVFGLSAATWTTAIMVAGGMMVNALLPPPKPKQPVESSPSYGIDGAKNTSAEGVVVPVPYGKFRWAGNLINNHVINDGDTQWLYLLINAGEGPVENITDILINDQPTSAYKDVHIEKRMGEPDQLPIGWFGQTITAQSVGHKLTTDWHIVTCDSEIDQARFDLTFPAGLYRMNDSDQVSHVVPFEVEGRKVGDSSWFQVRLRAVDQGTIPVTAWFPKNLLDTNGHPVGETEPYTPTGAEYEEDGQWYLDDPLLGKTLVGTTQILPVYPTGQFYITANQKTPVRRSVITDTLSEEAVYEFRMRRTNDEQMGVDAHIFDEVYWTDLNLVTTEQVGYRNTALIGLKIRLTDQLDGIPTVTHLNWGKKVRIWNDTAGVWDYRGSSNPAWSTFDVLSNKRYGGGASDSRFIMEQWKDFARFCDTNSLEFNGVFDTQSNVWDAAQTIMRCGHGQIVPVGTRYGVVVERPDTAVMMFSVANMVKGSFKESWSGLTERANEIEGTYYDELDGYKQRTIRVYDAHAIAAGYPQRTSTVDLRGVTKAQQAWDDLNIMLNMNRYIQRSIQFTAPIDAIACTVGSVILVQHDMPKWGTGGRFDGGSTSTVLQLDREVTLENGKNYKVLAHYSALQRYTGTIATVLNTGSDSSLTLNGFDGVQKVDRLKLGTTDVPVRGTFSSGASHGVVVDPVTAAAGDTYELWVTDALEMQDVVNTAAPGVPVVTMTVTAASPLPAAPAKYSNFMFGEANKVAKPFRVKSITGSQDYHRDIHAIEYNESVYAGTGAVPTPNYSGLDTSVQQATIDGVDEALQQHGLSYKSRVTVRFSSTQQTYQASNVYVSRNGGPFAWAGKDIYSVTVDGGQGEVLVFRVVAMDVLGVSAPESNAPTSSYTVLGKTDAPAQTSGITYAFTDTGIQMNWATPAEPDWSATQAATDPDYPVDQVVFDAKATAFLWAFQPSGNRSLWFRNVIQGTLASSPVEKVVPVLVPAMPAILDVTTDGLTVHMRWSDAKTSQPIRRYEVRLGEVTDTFATASEIAQCPGSQTTLTAVVLAGHYRLFIKAIDMAGNASAVGTIDFDVTFTDVDAMLSALTGQITESQLSASLGESIGKIRSLEDATNNGAATDLAAIVGAYQSSKTVGQALTVAKQTLTESIATVDGRVTAEATARLELAAAVDDAVAAIATESTTRATADSALSSSVSTLTTTVNGNYSTVQSQISALSEADYTMATDIATLTTHVNDNTAAISTESSVRADQTGYLGAQYTVRTQLTSGGRTVMGGFGISATSAGGAQPTIDFGVQADKFWIGAPSSTAGISDIIPFIVQTTDTVINGVTIPKGVYMDAAFIVNLTAMVARLGSAWITNAMVDTLDAAKITVGTLSVDRIQDGAITQEFFDEQFSPVTLGSGSDVEICNASVTAPSGSIWNGEVMTTLLLTRSAYATSQVGFTIKLQAFVSGAWVDVRSVNPNVPGTSLPYNITAVLSAPWDASHWGTATAWRVTVNGPAGPTTTNASGILMIKSFRK